MSAIPCWWQIACPAAITLLLFLLVWYKYTFKKAMSKHLSKRIASLLFQIDVNSGYEADSEPIDFGDATNIDEAAANIESGKCQEPFDLIHHQGKDWTREKWKKHCEYCNKKREFAIKAFLKLVKEREITAKQIFKVLQKIEKDRQPYGFPWGLPYARIFLSKWRSWSW